MIRFYSFNIFNLNPIQIRISEVGYMTNRLDKSKVVSNLKLLQVMKYLLFLLSIYKLFNFYEELVKCI